jgi:uncharacterized protein involved in exopolysaccharide biosynthesis
MMSTANGFDVVLRFVDTLVRKKRIVILGTLVPTLICIVAVMVTKSMYQSQAVINPPQSQDGSQLGALAAASGMGDLLGSISGSESGLNDCVTLLESTRFASLVIKRFDLETVYEFREKKKYFHSDVIKRFRKHASYELTDEDAIRLTVKDRSPERAKQIAEYMVFLLDSLYTDLQQQAIKHRLAYVDERLAFTLQETRALEDSLIRFQNRNNFLVPETQVRLILENTARTELSLGTLREEMMLEGELRGTGSARYKELQSEIRLSERALKAKLRSPADSNSLLLPTQTLPSLVTEYFRLERAYTVRLGVYKYLVQQVEMLRLDVNKNVQVISVIDPPWLNTKRVSPKRRILVQTVFFLFFILSCITALLVSLWEQNRREHPQLGRRVSDIRAGLFKL